MGPAVPRPVAVPPAAVRLATDTPPPPGPQLAPCSRFPVSSTSLGRVIASDLPSEPLTLRHGRPHLRSLSPEPHRPRTLRRAAGSSARGAAGGCFLTSEGCPGAPALKIKERASPRSLSGFGTVTRIRPAQAQTCPQWHGGDQGQDP